MEERRTYTEAQSEMNVRVMNTETGEIITAVEGAGSKRLLNVSGVISMSAMERGGAGAPEAAIVGSGADGAIYIDQGENHGVRVGQRYEGDMLRPLE